MPELVASVGHPDGLSAAEARPEGLRAYSFARIRGLEAAADADDFPLVAQHRESVFAGPCIMKLIRWFASLPLTLVAAHSLLAGLLLSSTEAAGWNEWGHYGLLLAVVPIVAWLLARWKTDPNKAKR